MLGTAEKERNSFSAVFFFYQLLFIYLSSSLK